MSDNLDNLLKEALRPEFAPSKELNVQTMQIAESMAYAKRRKPTLKGWLRVHQGQLAMALSLVLVAGVALYMVTASGPKTVMRESAVASSEYTYDCEAEACTEVYEEADFDVAEGAELPAVTGATSNSGMKFSVASETSAEALPETMMEDGGLTSEKEKTLTTSIALYSYEYTNSAGIKFLVRLEDERRIASIYDSENEYLGTLVFEDMSDETINEVFEKLTFENE